MHRTWNWLYYVDGMFSYVYAKCCRAPRPPETTSEAFARGDTYRTHTCEGSARIHLFVLYVCTIRIERGTGICRRSTLGINLRVADASEPNPMKCVQLCRVCRALSVFELPSICILHLGDVVVSTDLFMLSDCLTICL